MLGLVKHRELRFGSHAHEVEEAYPAKFQDERMSLRLSSGARSLRVPSVVFDCSSSPYGHDQNST